MTMMKAVVFIEPGRIELVNDGYPSQDGELCLYLLTVAPQNTLYYSLLENKLRGNNEYYS